MAPDAADIELLRDGSMTVRQAAEWSGLSRSELFALMADGTLPWWTHGQKKRLIPRRPLAELLAAEYAAQKRSG